MSVAGDDPDEELLRGPVDAPPPSWPPLQARIEQADAAAQLLAFRADGQLPRELALEFASLEDGLVMVTGEGADRTGEATEVVARRLSRTVLVGVAVHALGLVGRLS